MNDNIKKWLAEALTIGSFDGEAWREVVPAQDLQDSYFKWGGVLESDAQIYEFHNDLTMIFSRFLRKDGVFFLLGRLPETISRFEKIAGVKVIRVEQPNPYFKDVSHLNYIDVYRVLTLYNVTDPCIQHAVKKLLCAGQRGTKDFDKDIAEAIDSLLRLQALKKEDSK